VFHITLKAARVNAGFTRKEVAKIFGCHSQTIANYEYDSTNVPRPFFMKLEEVYGIPMQYLYFGQEEKFHEEKRKVLSAV